MASHRRTIAAAAATILASISLYPVFIGTAWFWSGAGAVLAVAGAGTLTRLRRLPVAVCVAGVLAGLLLYLNLVFSNGRSLGHLLPTATSLRLLWDLAGQGFHESAKYAPPVPTLSGMVLLAAGGIGITALLTDLIAVRLGSAALAGLPLLLLFIEPFTLSISRDALGTTIAFCAATAGYLWMLSSEGRDRIRAWEHPNPDPRLMPDTTAVAAAGRRVGAASMVVALCVPLIIPGLHVTRLFGSGQPGIGGRGPGVGVGGGVGFPDPNTQLSNELHTSQPQVVFSYSTTATNPQYFQVYVLDNLTASQGWKIFGRPPDLATVTPQLPGAPGLESAVSSSFAKVTTHVTMSGSVSQDQYNALPVPYPATAVTAPGSLQADRSSLMVFDSGQRLAGLSYSVKSLDEAPHANDVSNAPPASAATGYYTQLPASYLPLRGLAQSVVKAAGAGTAFQDALALQQWLSESGGFRYTLAAPSVISASGLANFLEHTKKGYCQQFSFAMAALARLLGIPARVAIGFTAGTPVTGNQWVVTTHDAHSWPELYFEGFGWLRFEPTPQGSAPGQGTATAPVYTLNTAGTLPGSSAGSQQGGTSPTSGAVSNRNAALGRLGLPVGGAGGAAAGGRPAGVNPWEVLGFCVLGLAVIAAAAPASVRLLVRQRRWRGRAARADTAQAHAAWRELRDDLVDYRVGYLPSQSPRRVAARTASTLELAPPDAAALDRIAMAEERARYAPRAGSGAGLRADSAAVRRAVAAAVPRWTRWRARLLPSSVLSPALTAVLQATDIFGRLNPERFAKARLSRAENLLQVSLLPSAPAFVQALHHRAATAPAAVLLPSPALGRRTAPGHGKRHAGHVPPAVQRPDAADQHDDEPAYGEPDHRQDDTRRNHARADTETGGRLNHPAPVVHAGITGPY